MSNVTWKIPAENGNTYTVMIGGDGMFSAEYVMPPALSIPLGSSGSAVDVVEPENGTFSVMVGGEYQVITAETMVTAANGNVYRAVLSPEGVPVGVSHVAAMQDVMLGELGGSVTLTQAEDMSWWLGSEAVDVASEVNSDNGNTYSLWYTDGVWSARFEPESMMIEGTGLVAMTRDADDMYDGDGDTLPASGAGEITTSAGAMYRVSMPIIPSSELAPRLRPPSRRVGP